MHSVTGFGYKALPWVLLALFVFPWLFQQAGMVVPADAGWFGLIAEKVMSGQRLSDVYADSNLPMSFLIYIPYAFLNFAGFDPTYSILIYGGGIALVSTLLIFRMLAYNSGLPEIAVWGFITCYLFVNLFLFRIEFGNKDSLLACVIVPFVLAQYCLTYKLNEKGGAVKLAILIGAPFMLIKPHYGLICVVMLLHRVWLRRKVSAFFGFDFFVMAAAVLAYLAGSILFFGDYLGDNLSVFSVRFYGFVIYGFVLENILGLASIGVFLLIVSLFCNNGDHLGKITILMSVMTLFCALVFFLQLKGYSAHIVPYYSFLLPAGFLVIFVSCFKPSGTVRPFVVAAIMLIILSLGHFQIINDPVSKVDDLRRSDFYAYIKENASGTSFLVQSNSTNVIIPVSLYSGVPHATRFPSFWWLHEASRPENAAYVPLLAKMVAEDLEKFRPRVILLWQRPEPGYDFIGLFGENPDFARAFSAYDKKEVLEVDYQQFFRSDISGRFTGLENKVYDVYIRR